MRHQQFSYHVFNSRCSFETLKTDNILSIKLSEFLESFDVIEELRKYPNYTDCGLDTKVFTTNQIWFRSYNYRRDFVVCFGFGPIFPMFGIIMDFILLNDVVCLLLVREINVEYFERKLFAYKVNVNNDSFRLIGVNNLAIHECMELQQNVKLDSNYIVTRHHL